ncbi:hypothetical protein Phum_PHUM366970 [Pediculus humanus corporis]|uniref:Uncharacterized protein n=1 Tax=Pediculus humanus subsp. corporis TaxID=121224 RepID=E0VPX1_PEDHC|nr:uncharacterized protein Phum_PHUM366970 [Pediculus humanus corporis]EEB15427.1 hypothetical protein Phum_PHUM366970 [Pediculus humanus corporis]
MDRKVLAFLFCLTICSNIQSSHSKFHSYRAAVVEYHPVVKDTNEASLNENLKAYDYAINDAHSAVNKKFFFLYLKSYIDNDNKTH